MIKTECQLSGYEFKPFLLMKKLEYIEFKNVVNPGDIGTLGRYKGKPVPYGSCTITTPIAVKSGKRIEWMADFIKEHIKIFREYGATDIYFQINWTGIQGNMELTVVELQKLADLKIPISMNYIFIKDE